MSFPKIEGITRLKFFSRTQLQAVRLLLYRCRVVFQLQLLLLQCFGKNFFKYEVSSLMRSRFKILEYAVRSRSNEFDCGVERVIKLQITVPL